LCWDHLRSQSRIHKIRRRIQFAGLSNCDS
jgi:hypothetical protein